MQTRSYSAIGAAAALCYFCGPAFALGRDDLSRIVVMDIPLTHGTLRYRPDVIGYPSPPFRDVLAFDFLPADIHRDWFEGLSIPDYSSYIGSQLDICNLYGAPLFLDQDIQVGISLRQARGTSLLFVIDHPHCETLSRAMGAMVAPTTSPDGGAQTVPETAESGESDDWILDNWDSLSPEAQEAYLNLQATEQRIIDMILD